MHMVSPLQLDEHAPWRRRFRCNTLGSAYVAPLRPTRGIVHASLDGSRRHIYAWNVASGEMRRMTGEEPAPSYGWLDPNADYLYFLRDERGSEIGHLARIPYAGGPAQDITPELPPYTLRGFDISRDGRLLAFDAVFEGRYRFYVVELGGNLPFSPPRLIFSAAEESWACHLSYEGRLLAVKSTRRAPHSRRYATLVFDTGRGGQVAELWDGFDHSVEPVQFSPLPGDERLLATTTAGGALQPLLWDPRSGERRDPAPASGERGVFPIDWSPDGASLLVQSARDDHSGLFLFDLSDGALRALNHPPGSFRGREGTFHTGTPATFFGPDGTVWAHWSSSAHAPRLLSLAGDRPPRPVLPAANCPPGHPWRSVRFPSSDGVSVQAWLGLPQGQSRPSEPLPTVLHVHGGPSGCVSDSFDPVSQAWLDHGFAYLSVNYRGSTGFGRAFQEKINGDVGHWELEDMLAARRWLIENGIAARDKILLEGGSYGGFLTVWALTQAPDLWAAGVAPVAIVDWTMNYEESSAAMQGWARMLFGGTPGQKPRLYRDRSPLTHAAAIEAPLLIFQGRFDSRAAPRQMERFARKMQRLNKDFTLIWLDSGHGSDSAATAERMQAAHMELACRAMGLPQTDVE